MAGVRGRMDQLIKDYKVFVVSKRGCPFCVTAKKVLDKYDIPPDKMKVMEIDGDKDCAEIQNYMHTLTGGRTVPRVFIDGKCIGGGNETASAHKNKSLEKLLRDAGAIV